MRFSLESLMLRAMLVCIASGLVKHAGLWQFWATPKKISFIFVFVFISIFIFFLMAVLGHEQFFFVFYFISFCFVLFKFLFCFCRFRFHFNIYIFSLWQSWATIVLYWSMHSLLNCFQGSFIVGFEKPLCSVPLKASRNAPGANFWVSTSSSNLAASCQSRVRTYNCCSWSTTLF